MEVVSEKIGVRPLSALVFGMSVLALIAMEVDTGRTVDAKAVANAMPVEHPSVIDSRVSVVHVKPGDIVEAGQTLATLSRRTLERLLRDLDADIAKLKAELRYNLKQLETDHNALRRDVELRQIQAKRNANRSGATANSKKKRKQVAATQLNKIDSDVQKKLRPDSELHDAEQQFGFESAEHSGARKAAKADLEENEELKKIEDALPENSELIEPTKELYATMIAELELQRDAVLEDLSNTTITARAPGRIESILPQGSHAPLGTSVATLMPVNTSEVIAYLPPETDASRVAVGGEVKVRSAQSDCRSGVISRLGATVQLAPGQLQTMFRGDVHGLPVYIELPESCKLGIGQLVAVEIEVQ